MDTPDVWGIDGDIVAYRVAYVAQKDGKPWRRLALARRLPFNPSSTR